MDRHGGKPASGVAITITTSQHPGLRDQLKILAGIDRFVTCTDRSNNYDT